MNGFINVYKDENVTSAKVVSIIKHLTHEKAGHLGTLDPLASGVLPIAIGKATKLFDYFLNKDKIYIAKAKFGFETDTLDLSGQIIKENKKVPTKAEILKILPKFKGKQFQMPPIYSAKNVNGVRAYDLARQGKSFSLEPKQIEIFDISLISFKNNEAEFEIHCSAGTYVRSLIRDIAYNLETVATTSKIFRIKSGIFEINNAYKLDELNENLKDIVIPIKEVLKGLKQFNLNSELQYKLICGQKVKLDNIDFCDNLVLVATNNEIYGIADVVNHFVKVKTFLLEQ